MKKLIDNLKKAITDYEYCVYVGANDSVIAEKLKVLSKCSKEVDKECEVRYNTMLDDD